MKIAVCIKQVPANNNGLMNTDTGHMIREKTAVIMNVYDLPAIETALRIKEQMGGIVDVFSMGPARAEEMIREAYSLGVDKGYLLCDGAFAGADVLATSYTLVQGIRLMDQYDIILCGKQTTDGDTAQVSGAIAKWLDIPGINWVSAIREITEQSITVDQLMGDKTMTLQVPFPCLLSVEQNIYTPRLPSLKLKIAAKNKEITILRLHDLADQDAEHYGQAGSATRVEKIYQNTKTQQQPVVEICGDQAAEYIRNIYQDIMRP